MQGIFLLALLLPVLVIVYWAVVPARLRSGFLMLASVAFVAYSLWVQALKEGISPLPAAGGLTLYFIVTVALTHRAAAVIRQKGPRHRALFKATLFWLIGNLCFFKYINQGVNLLLEQLDRRGYELTVAIPDVILPVGVSYVIFRLIHFTVETHRGRIKESPSFTDLATYTLFFPTFRSGPVDRFPRFQPQTAAHKPLDVGDINYGLFRIISGLVKKVLAADPLRALVLPVLRAPMGYSRGGIVAALYGLAIQVYMDFSGYTDIAVGTGRLFGYKVMENFNLPYFKPNLAELWRNWHISVYSWIRDYFFLPLFAVKGGKVRMYLGVLLTFVVFMLWHEGSWRFLILGVYHGVGMMVWTWFQSFKRTHPGAKELAQFNELRPLWTFLSVTFYGFGFVFFVLEVQGVWELLQALWG